jgi:hypothetical protein
MSQGECQVCVFKSTEVRWFTVVRSVIIQGRGKGGFVFGKKFPHLSLNLRRGVLK